MKLSGRLLESAIDVLTLTYLVETLFVEANLVPQVWTYPAAGVSLGGQLYSQCENTVLVYSGSPPFQSIQLCIV